MIYPDSLGMRKALAKRVELDSFEGMIRPGFLLGGERSALIALARDGSVTHRLARRANALVLLDDGLSCEQVARVLLLDDDTIRRWHGAFAEGGRKALMRFEAGGSACVLSEAQRGNLVGWVRAASPRSTGQIGAWIASEFGVEYESRSGLVALLHRLGLEYRKPEVIPRHLDETKQRAFIKLYEKLMNALGADEAVLFVDAVHPTHGARAAGDWADQNDRGRGHRRRFNDQTPRGHRGALFHHGADPCVSRQCALSSRQDCPEVAIATRTQDRVAFRPVVLPASQSHRAAVGADAPASHPQQDLPNVSGIRRRHSQLPTRRSPEEMGRVLRFGH